MLGPRKKSNFSPVDEPPVWEILLAFSDGFIIRKMSLLLRFLRRLRTSCQSENGRAQSSFNHSPSCLPMIPAPIALSAAPAHSLHPDAHISQSHTLLAVALLHFFTLPHNF